LFGRNIRPFIKFVKDEVECGEKRVGVEVGVFYGDNAFCMLKHLRIEKLFLVDPYVAYRDTDGWKDDEFMANARMLARRRLKIFGNVVWVEKQSSDAVDDVVDGLDFVYIDGCHSYESVKNDIKVWFPKVKKAGVIGGHDFRPNMSNGNGVAKAVVDCFPMERVMGCYPDWWVIK